MRRFTEKKKSVKEGLKRRMNECLSVCEEGKNEELSNQIM